MKFAVLLLPVVLLLFLEPTLAFNPIAVAAATLGPLARGKSKAVADSNTNNLVAQKVAVIGATGRLGRLVVQELVNRGAPEVVAIVRSKSKANNVFGNMTASTKNVKFIECDLTNQKSIEKSLEGMEAAIWCATGFSGDPNFVERMKNLLGIATKQSIDLVALPLVAKAIEKQQETTEKDGELSPKVVMCSSAGVTRPTWDKAKKARFAGAADIPIVRLNPFGILDTKRESEQKLRNCNVPYCIIRPAGLNDKWPASSRPVLSQGDVAVGRIHRQDVATLLVDVLSEPAATGKTMEVISLANYPRGDAAALRSALERLSLDTKDQDELSLDAIAATYAAMQQLLPGEKQNAAALAMGQTYEQFDKGETGRLGKRGQEDAEGQISPTNK